MEVGDLILYHALGYKIQVEHRVRCDGSCHALEYRISEILEPFFAETGGDSVVRGRWQSLGTYHSKREARRALQMIKKLWGLGDYIRAQNSSKKDLKAKLKALRLNPVEV